MPREWRRVRQSSEVICTPLSHVKRSGTPNLATQPAREVAAQLAAVTEERGQASSLRVERSRRKMVHVEEGPQCPRAHEKIFSPEQGNVEEWQLVATKLWGDGTVGSLCSMLPHLPQCLARANGRKEAGM